MRLITPKFKKPYIELENEQEKELFKLDKDKEIKRLKEEYVMLQNASDEVEEEKDKEIERLNNIINKAIKWFENADRRGLNELLDILKGSDKE